MKQDEGRPLKRDMIVMGASAGGVEALSRIVQALPHELRASIMIVLHISRGRSLLPEILTRVAQMPASHAVDGEAVEYSRIYVARPDHHLVIENGLVRVVHAASENGVRPALDPLFRSAAREYGSRVIGVVLTGTLDDGTAGIAAVKQAGGVTIAQDPEDAFAPGMPRSAIATGFVDHILPLRDIPLLLTALVQEDAPEGVPRGDRSHLRQMEPDLATERLAVHNGDRPGRPSVFTCPECHGTLWETEDGGLYRFRCRVGHAYSPESMLAAQTDEVDRALWIALRTLEERAALAHRLAERGRARGQAKVDRAFTMRAQQAMTEVARLRELLRSRGGAHDHSVPDEGAAAALPDPPIEGR